MTEAYVGLGGNVGDPRRAMARALDLLDADPQVTVSAVSPLYRTPPWGKTDQPDYLNAVARLVTGLTARGLMERCLETERALGRIRGERWGPRPIDLDLLLFGSETIEEDGLHVPHPRMGERAFVMIPLADITPGLRLKGVAAAELAASLPSAGIERIAASGDWWRAARAQ
ncbi:MAG: 2-amino-4-hydroxy-6-hydroxymethyldihydropteridine diphosphokinase [Rhizobiaceae bacterium]|nr:2-amino-4-hydroxy-6-hydroxymethyldihydropteridine diphosphokinase [Rhizobiaceae bacterium]MCV0407398.1 2-amino-4-hydroxy-6-hydroxymethyldihydropteridine diphosphokinase [Rhizobiaceae bacterium]